MEHTRLSQGAELTPQGVQYRVWAPGRTQVSVVVQGAGGSPGARREVAMQGEERGYFSGLDAAGRAGDRYQWRLEAGGELLPCPASRFQPEDVSGPSMVVDASTFRWTDGAWRRPPFRDLVIYELHVGTFTPDGTFEGAISRLAYLRELGVRAIEIMPVNDFPGKRGWGYDGVRIFAPARIYGAPDALRALVDAAHGQGLAVILDVVYNHFGPDGNFLEHFSPDYFETRHHTPWGKAINFGAPNNHAVRELYKSNLRYWIEEFHFDGFRLDATHTIFDDSSRHILSELVEIAHEQGCYMIAEDERNIANFITAPAEGGLGFNAVWADDFHHSVESVLIGASIYATQYEGKVHEIVNVLQNGWVYPQEEQNKGPRHNTPCGHLPAERFVFCISNHDQAGNRALGERLNHLVDAANYRAVSALLCLVPFTPILFMGQEWAASSPFQYFTDHAHALGEMIDQGRRKDMEKFPILIEALGDKEVPPPQEEQTFLDSCLRWDEILEDEHANVLRLYKAVLKLRNDHEAFRPLDRAGVHVAELTCGILAIRASRAKGPEDDWLVLASLDGNPRPGHVTDEPFCKLEEQWQWEPVLSSNGAAFGGNESISYEKASGKISFLTAEVLVLKAQKVS